MANKTPLSAELIELARLLTQEQQSHQGAGECFRSSLSRGTQEQRAKATWLLKRTSGQRLERATELRSIADKARLDIGAELHKLAIVLETSGAPVADRLCELATQAATPAAAAVESNGAKRAPKRTRRRRQPGGLNAEMKVMLIGRPESIGWTADEWGKEIKAHPSQIVKQPAWKKLEEFREKQKIERQASKRRGRVGQAMK